MRFIPGALQRGRILTPRWARTKWGVLLLACATGAVALWVLFQGRAGERLVPQSLPRVGSFDIGRIPEDSGVVESRRHPGIYWTHSDSGHEPLLFALDRRGQVLGTFRVNAPNTDWEDIATDDQGHLLIADTGNNSGRRSQVAVIEVAEPELDQAQKLLEPQRIWHLQFPGAPFNAEGLFAWQDHGYLVSKVPAGQAASLYEFDLHPQDGSTLLRKIATLPVTAPVTGACIDADGGRVAILTTDELDIFVVDGDVALLAERPPTRLPLATPNRLEGCCFTRGGVMLTSEYGEMYLVPERRLAPLPATVP